MFFKKKTHPASELYQHFSEEEKLIILCLLYGAMICDNEITNNQIQEELKYLNTYVHIFETSAKKVTQLYNRIGPAKVFEKFTEMNASKIEDVLMLIFGMLTCDGQLNEMEAAFLSTMLEKANISEAEFIEKVKKVDALFKYFNQ